MMAPNRLPGDTYTWCTADWNSGSVCPGRSWMSLPPIATLMSCMPRHIPSVGMSSSIA